VPVGVAIDPGGIGKGLAADLAVARAMAGGAAGCLVSIGGDLAMGGTSPDVDGWLVAVERVDPADGELCRLAVSGGGVATSSTRSRRWVHEGHPIHHVIDPATGRPSDTDLASVTIVDRTAWRAEAHATAALLEGSASVLDHLRRDQLTGVVVSDDGRILHTRDLDGVEFHLPSGVA